MRRWARGGVAVDAQRPVREKWRLTDVERVAAVRAAAQEGITVELVAATLGVDPWFIRTWRRCMQMGSLEAPDTELVEWVVEQIVLTVAEFKRLTELAQSYQKKALELQGQAKDVWPRVLRDGVDGMQGERLVGQGGDGASRPARQPL